MALDFLSMYGSSFQTRVIALLITDRDFLAQTFDVLTPDFFDSDANKEIVGIIKDYYTKYNSSPGFQVFAIKIAEMNDGVVKTTIVEQLRATKQFIDTPNDARYIKDEFKGFCRNQKLKSAILESVPLLKAGKYDDIKILIDTAMQAGMSRNIGSNYTKTVAERYSKPSRQKIVPTEWNVINEILDGGLGEGDLGVMVGITGTGKCVGPNTKIEIQYEEIGIDENGIVKWYKPWQLIEIDDKKIYAWQLV
jgi:hypothetical protein